MNNKIMNSKSRTLVNIVGVPLILGAIYLGGYFFIAFIGLIIIIGTFEYNKLLKKNSAQPLIVLLMISNILLIVSSIFITSIYQGLFDSTFLIFFVIHFIYLILFTIVAMIVEVFNNSKTSILNISSTVFGFIWIGLFINSLIYFRLFSGQELALITFLSLWICDTFAFFFGKNFGVMKILPKVSPNKTVVGALSGLLGSICFLIIMSYSGIVDISLMSSIILGLITGGVSQFGDFFESKLKREANIKDTSNLLKGHGGILDRFDSLSIISPLLMIYAIIRIMM